MESRRIDNVYDFSCAVVFAYVASKYNIIVEGRKNLPRKGPALLLAKHQAQLDILLEGIMLKRHAQRRGNWIMKYELPRPLHWLGGIEVARPQDVQNLGYLTQEVADECNSKAVDYVNHLWQQGEIVIVHPEGKRYPFKMGDTKSVFIPIAKRTQRKHNITIPIIPVGIEYSSGSINSSNIYVRVGEQLNPNTKGIHDIVKEEIARLSNL